MKFSSKAEFVQRTDQQWQLLWQWVESCRQDQTQLKELKQVLAHLHAWHRLTLGWYQQGLQGDPDLPAVGYNWSQTRSLNAELDAEFEPVDIESVIRRLKRSHGRVMKMVHSLSESQFLKSGIFAWTGKNALVAYVAPNTFSHYRWAIKKIKSL